MRRIAILFTFFILHFSVWSQNTFTIPANTGYAVPAENDEESLFQPGKGLQNWTDIKQEIHYFFHIAQEGKLLIALNLKNAEAGSIISVEIANKTFRLSIPQSTTFQKKILGIVRILRCMAMSRLKKRKTQKTNAIYTFLTDKEQRPKVIYFFKIFFWSSFWLVCAILIVIFLCRMSGV